MMLVEEDQVSDKYIMINILYIMFGKQALILANYIALSRYWQSLNLAG